jgi:hypothetical protein
MYTLSRKPVKPPFFFEKGEASLGSWPCQEFVGAEMSTTRGNVEVWLGV